MLITNLQKLRPFLILFGLLKHFKIIVLFQSAKVQSDGVQVTLSCFLQEVEAALEAEESKVTRAQLELTQYKQEAEKRIADKDEELENIRYARAVKCLS